MNRPFGGAYELTQILLAALVFAALPLTSTDGGHVEVDLALHLFPPPVPRGMAMLCAISFGSRPIFAQASASTADADSESAPLLGTATLSISLSFSWSAPAARGDGAELCRVD